MTKATPRKFVSITRTVATWIDNGSTHNECHYIDAVADDGTAWHFEEGGQTDWVQLPPLPSREE